jgi:hypothetical protein
MNWKKWVGLFGAGTLVLALSWMPRQSSVISSIPRDAYADSYQLAVSSSTVFWVQVATFGWTQVDVPQLVGRTSLTVYNIDASSPIYCRNDNTLVNDIATNNSTTQPSNTFVISAAGTSSPPSWVNLSLSNFSSSRGAYPVSTSMPLYCVSARVGGSINASTAAVVQSY